MLDKDINAIGRSVDFIKQPHRKSHMDCSNLKRYKVVRNSVSNHHENVKSQSKTLMEIYAVVSLVKSQNLIKEYQVSNKTIQRK